MKYIMIIKLIAVNFLLLHAANSIFAQQTTPVKMWMEKMTLPTYKTGAPDKNPLFYTPAEYQGAQRHIYPYPFVGEITNEKINKEYVGVFLENEYIKICVTPEMGGRLYYAIDKTNNYNIVYYNHVVKPALIGMAGAWTSGGAEWNIPHHHRPTSFLPVDYTLEENDDGSKTVWVGEYEKRSQTRWIVGLTVEQGKAYIKTEFRYFNVTPIQNTFLFWANTAVHANENYQVIFPPDVEKAVYHAKTEFVNWPIANQVYQGIDFTNGQDISWWKNTAQPTSFFAWDTKQDFLAGIDHGKKAGTIKVGDRFVFRGKKFWNWGPNNVGKSWDKKLTDEDGPYLELMMGGYSDNQPDYSFINPMSTKQGTMYYYGIRNMDNVKEANAEFAINLEQKNAKAFIQVNATSVNKNVTVYLTNKGASLLKEAITIDPAKPYSKELRLPANTAYTDLKIQLISAEGNEMISWQPAPKKNEAHPIAYKSPANPNEYTSDDDLWLAGLRLEQFGNANFDPGKYYDEALQRDSLDVLVNTQVGINFLRKEMYEQAENHFRIAAARVTSNHTKPKFAEPLYYLGVTLMKQEKNDEAREWLHQAAWSYEWSSPSYTLLAQLECLRHDWKRAAENVEKACLANSSNIEALNLTTMILRHAGHYKQGFETASNAIAIDPLNFNILNELYLLSSKVNTGKSTNEWLKILKEKLRDEPDNYLETATRYGAAGFFEEAIDVLGIAVASLDKVVRSNPMIYYHAGYYAALNGDKSRALQYFQKASQQKH